MVHTETQPPDPFLVVAAGAELGNDGLDPRCVGEDTGVQLHELAPEQRQEQHFALVATELGHLVARGIAPAQLRTPQVPQNLRLDRGLLAEETLDDGRGRNRGILAVSHG